MNIPWPLLLSAVPVILLLLTLVRYEVKCTLHHKRQKQEEKDILSPVIREVQEKHTKKFGRPDIELEREFQELREAK
jgi:hypothetical protein